MILVVFQVLTWIFKGQGLTLSSSGEINVVNQYSYILILAIGMVMVIIMGHIDLSVGLVRGVHRHDRRQGGTGTCRGRWPSSSASALGAAGGRLARILGRACLRGARIHR